MSIETKTHSKDQFHHSVCVVFAALENAKIVHLRFSGSVLAVGLLYKLPQR